MDLFFEVLFYGTILQLTTENSKDATIPYIPQNLTSQGKYIFTNR